jgi:hypothetical protein
VRRGSPRSPAEPRRRPAGPGLNPGTAGADEMVMSFSPEPTHATAGATTRCRSCGSRLRPDDEWCTLCLTRVVPDEPEADTAGPEAESEPEPEPEPESGSEPEAAGDEADEAAEATGEVPDGVPAEVDPDELARREAEAERMLAELSASESRAVPSRLAALNPGGRAGGVVLATLGGVVVLAVLMAGMAVVGRFL